MGQAMSARAASAAAILLLATCTAAPMYHDAQSEPVAVPTSQLAAASTGADWAAQCEDWDDWDEPAEPFHIFGNTYYVGTCGIASILIAGEEGHVLLDSGTEAGARIVARNIAAIGADVRDILLLGYSHEHFDHVGGMAYLQRLSGASLMSLRAGAETMRIGRSAPADPQAGMHAPFAPVRVDFQQDGGQSIAMENGLLTVHPTPGHTPGAASWQWESCEGAVCRTIVYADSLSAISADGYRFLDHPEYVQAFRDGIARLAALDCDILLTPHPSASGMRDKLMAGDLTGGMDCAGYAADRLAMLETRLAREAGR